MENYDPIAIVDVGGASCLSHAIWMRWSFTRPARVKNKRWLSFHPFSGLGPYFQTNPFWVVWKYTWCFLLTFAITTTIHACHQLIIPVYHKNQFRNFMNQFDGTIFSHGPRSVKLIALTLSIFIWGGYKQITCSSRQIFLGFGRRPSSVAWGNSVPHPSARWGKNWIWWMVQWIHVLCFFLTIFTVNEL